MISVAAVPERLPSIGDQRMRTVVSSALLRVWLGVGLVLSHTMSTADETGPWINAQREHWKVPGVAVAIVRTNQAPELYASGLCNIERAISCSIDSPFYMGSMTKFVTGLIAATLATEKRVTLDEPLIHRWSDFRLSDVRWTDITLRDLLSQRSGLGSVDWPFFWDESLTRKDYVARAQYFPMAKPFRASFNYANANFVVAGSYLEHVTGKSWEDLVKTRLIEPLGMQHSGFESPEGKTVGYGIDSSGRFVPMPYLRTPAIGPAGSLVTTASDYAHFLTMLLDGGKWKGNEVLPMRAIDLATAPVVGHSFDRRFCGPPGGYGFGVWSCNYRDGMMLYHSGGYGGYTTHFALVPKLGIGIVVLSNQAQSGFPEALTVALLDRLIGLNGEETMTKFAAASQRKVILPSAQHVPPRTHPILEYHGRYENPAWGVFNVTSKGNELWIQQGPHNAHLEHHRYDSFSFAAMSNYDERLRVRFDADEDGNIAAIVLKDVDNAQAHRFERVKDKFNCGNAPTGTPQSRWLDWCR